MLPFLLFFFGLFAGSFLLVLADRLPRGESVLKGRSHCDSCQKTLEWYELIPVFSFVIQKGQCRKCKITLSKWYLTSEVLTGLIFGLTAFIFKDMNLFIMSVIILIVSLQISIAIADWRYGLIPFPLIMSSIILTFVYLLLVQPDLLSFHAFAGFSIAIIFFLLWSLTKGKGMGFGDVIYAFFMGLLLGFPSIVVALYIAFLTGAMVSLILVLLKKKKLKGSTIAFGPFLVFATLAVFFFKTFFLQIFTRLLF